MRFLLTCLEHFKAKWNHLATRKMRLNKGLERFP